MKSHNFNVIEKLLGLTIGGNSFPGGQCPPPPPPAMCGWRLSFERPPNTSKNDTGRLESLSSSECPMWKHLYNVSSKRCHVTQYVPFSPFKRGHMTQHPTLCYLWVQRLYSIIILSCYWNKHFLSSTVHLPVKVVSVMPCTFDLHQQEAGLELSHHLWSLLDAQNTAVKFAPPGLPSWLVQEILNGSDQGVWSQVLHLLVLA